MQSPFLKLRAIRSHFQGEGQNVLCLCIITIKDLKMTIYKHSTELRGKSSYIYHPKFSRAGVYLHIYSQATGGPSILLLGLLRLP